MAFKQRKDAGSSALDKVSSGYAPDPKEFPYSKELEVGEGVVVRFLSLHEEDTGVQSVRRVTVKSAKHRDSEGIVVAVPDPGDDYNDDIYDDNGTPLSECEARTVLWLPVWVLYTVDKNGVLDETIDELRYVKFGPGLMKSLKKLQENVKDGYDFDVIPSYDVRIDVINDNGINNYTLTPVNRILESAGKGKKPTATECPRYGVEDLAEALGADVMKVLDEEFDALIEHINECIEKEAAPDQVKKRFLGRGTGNVNAGKADQKSGGMRRGVAARANSEDENEDEGDGTEEPEVEADESTGPGRYSGGVGRSRFGRRS